MTEQGSLGDLVHDSVPTALIHATLHFVGKARQEVLGVGFAFGRALDDACIAHFGGTLGVGPNAVASLLNVETYLDYVEVVVEMGAKKRARGSSSGMAAAWGSVEADLNQMWDRHRFGYVLVEGEARRVGSPALLEVVVGPALLAAQRAGWGEVEKSYREAVLHQRGPAAENDDALTAAGAALEAALKAVGLSGTHLGPLASAFKQSDLAHPQIAETPELLHKLLQRVGAIRNEFQRLSRQARRRRGRSSGAS